MRRRFIGGNWKMNGSKELVGEMLGKFEKGMKEGVDVVLGLPSVYIHYGCGMTTIPISAQDISSEQKGSFTGEVSAEMVKDVGATWAIVGHSERRTLFGETDAVVNKKVHQGLSAGLGLIVCVGETLEEKEAGETIATIRRQLAAGLAGVAGKTDQPFVVAYEPVWAIGTGRVAGADDVQNMHSFIRAWIRENMSEKTGDETRIIYGGSVNAANCSALGAGKDVDGFLVGGASMSEEFVKIIL
ncbi:MAG: triosephosphate isomerase [Amphiamblys sp. WSBS2006]|nr:MAG: triosephosphate isomerase [Amphiamblys sp. WSBS2006]